MIDINQLNDSDICTRCTNYNFVIDYDKLSGIKSHKLSCDKLHFTNLNIENKDKIKYCKHLNKQKYENKKHYFRHNLRSYYW